MPECGTVATFTPRCARACTARGEACLPVPSPRAIAPTASGVAARVHRCKDGFAALLPLNGSSSCSSAAVGSCAAAPPRCRAAVVPFPASSGALDVRRALARARPSRWAPAFMPCAVCRVAVRARRVVHNGACECRRRARAWVGCRREHAWGCNTFNGGSAAAARRSCRLCRCCRTRRRCRRAPPPAFAPRASPLPRPPPTAAAADCYRRRPCRPCSRPSAATLWADAPRPAACDHVRTVHRHGCA